MSDEARATPTTKAGPTVRFDRVERAAVDVVGVYGVDGSCGVLDGWVGAGVCWVGMPVGVKGVSGSYIGSSGPAARLVCGQWSGAQDSNVGPLSESLVIAR
jgi:hypothetical protein